MRRTARTARVVGRHCRSSTIFYGALRRSRDRRHAGGWSRSFRSSCAGFADGWPTVGGARERLDTFLGALFERHVQAMNAPFGAAPAVANPAIATVSDDAADANETEVADTLLRGDWCVFEGEPGTAPVLATFAWRAPHGSQLLVTHRDGTIALIHTPESFSRAVRNGRARIDNRGDARLRARDGAPGAPAGGRQRLKQSR